MSYMIESYATETEDITSSQVTWDGADEDQLAFMRKVYDINYKYSSANGTFIGDIPDKELDTIEGKHKAKKDAAAACRDMLAAARDEIKKTGVKVETGLNSAYRSATRQLSLWESYFPDYYKDTATHRQSLPGGEHGDKAATYLAGYIRPKIATPGFSNHQNGIAVDILNVENGKTVVNKTKPPFPDEWRKSWLWEWLTANANTFGFYQNTKINEPWHWEYQGKTSGGLESYIEEAEDTMTDDSIPALLYRGSTPALETLYVKIDLGLRNERIFKKADARNDTATVEKMTGIFIPKNFTATPKVDLLIYLHGYKNEPIAKDGSINDYWNAKKFPHFGFREILNDSGNNFILVAPTLGPRSQAGTLITNAGFTNFIKQVIASIVQYCSLYANQDAPEINKIIIACHSGSGYNMYKIVQLASGNSIARKIAECWGFDCTYGPGDADALHEWATNFSKNVFIYYRKNSGTEDQAVALKNLSSGSTNIHVTGLPNPSDHNLIPGIYMKERLSAKQGTVEKESEATEDIDYDFPIVAPPIARKMYETTNPIKYNGVSATAFDLLRRGYISYEIFQKILGGERDLDTLTDMIFDYRHPARIRLSALVQSSELDQKRLKTEWNEIRSKILGPIFQNEDGSEKYTEATMNITRPELERPEQEGEHHGEAYERMKWFNESRFGMEKRPSRELLVAYAEARQQLRESITQENLEKLEESFLDIELAPATSKNNWAPLGPSVIEHGQAAGDPKVSGRITSIEVGPGGQRVYIGSANGGIWRSLDEGKSWNPLDDFFNSPDYISDIHTDSLSVGAIAVKFGKAASGDDDIVYVGTGEPVGGYLDIFGVGIKRSAKGGASKTWSLEANNVLEGGGVFRLAIDPDQNSKVYAASTKGLFVRDAKGAWTKVVSPAFAAADDQVSDFIISGSGKSKQYFAAFYKNGVLRSKDDGKTWDRVTGVVRFTSPNPGTRKVLAASESKPNIIYLLDENTNLLRLDSSATPLQFEAVNLNSLPLIGQGSYDLILAVDPSNENTVYIGGDFVQDDASVYSLGLFKGTISSTTGAFKFSFSFNAANSTKAHKDPTCVGIGIHPDGHALAFALDSAGTKHDGKRVWVGCDGGIFYSNSGGTNGSYKSMNDGLAITQMTYLAQSPDIPTVIFAGSQDNGELRLLGDKNWYESFQGDGGGVALDPSNPLNVIQQYTYASLVISKDGGQSFRWAPNPLRDADPKTSAESRRTRFYAPVAAIAGSSSTMWLFGTSRLWLSEDVGATWKTLPSATAPANIAVDSLGSKITALKALTKDIIYVTTQNSVFRYARSSGTWTNPINTPPIKDWSGNTVAATDYFITAIDSEGSSANNYYIALGGPGKFSKCYYYDGSKWYPTMSKKEKLDIPCSAIVVDPDHPNIIYLGSDVGVWKGVKSNKGNTWTWEHFSFGLPEVVILDLSIHNKARLLRAATHGRGVWEIALDDTSNKPVDLYLRLNPADNGRMDPRTKKRFDWNITSKGVPDPYSPGKYLVIPLNSPDIEVGPSHPMSSPLATVTVHNRGWKSANAKDVRVCLLMTAIPNSGTVPTLPKDFNTQINSGNSKKWLDGSDWKFADPIQPFSSPSRTLEGHGSQKVLFSPDFTQLTFTPYMGLKSVCFAAFIVSTDGSNVITATDVDIDQLVKNDNHVAQRRTFIT